MKPANPHILKVTPYKPGRPIDEVQRELGLRSVVKLASNENPYPPSPQVRRAIQAAGRSVNRYPDGGCYELRRTLAERLGVRGEQLVFGNGSDELLVLALRAYVAPGDEVVIARPSFLVYGIASRVIGARIREVPLENFRYDLGGMAKAVTRRTRLIFLGNPDNPAGTYIPRRELSAFLRKVRRDILVVLDEAYFEYVNAKDYPDGVKLLRRFPNLLVTRTFSKMYGLAGLRVGYGIARREVCDLINRVREPFNVNSIAQAAALACLQDTAYYRKIRGRVAKERRALTDGLARLGLKVEPSFTNFLLVHVPEDGDRLARRLLERGVIVREMGFWGLHRMIRVSIGTSRENRKFLKAMKGVLPSRR